MTRNPPQTRYPYPVNASTNSPDPKPMLKIAKGVKVSPKGAAVYCAPGMPLQDPTSVIALPAVPP
jgi:hypothetical protein